MYRDKGNIEKIKEFLARTRKITRIIGIVSITGVITHRIYPQIGADLLKIIKWPIKNGVKVAMGMGPINPSLDGIEGLINPSLHGIKGIRGAKGPINPYLVNPSLDGIKPAMGPIRDGVEGGRTIGFPGGF
jgi:hypothetical protein